MQKINPRHGFTLIEMIIVLGIVSLFTGFTLNSVSTAQTKNNFATSVTVITSDIKAQQLKAMVGDSEGRGSADNYGVHFAANPSQYVLFHGSVYNPADTSNFPINLDSTVEFSAINLPSGANVIFSQGSGEIIGYNASLNTVTLRNKTTNETQVLKFNKYGVLIP